MEFLQLKYFQEVAKFEHITKAAKNLNVSQPSLSNTITRVEKNLGVPLFVRQGRQIRLTSYGKVFLRRVNRALSELEEGKREIKAMAGLDNGFVSIATTLPSLLPLLLKDYYTAFPKARIKQKQALSHDEIKQQLENVEIDLCISTFPIIGADIKWLPLLEEEIFLSVPSWHKLANRKSINLNEAAEESFISITSEYGFRKMTVDFCRQAGFEPNISFEIAETGIIQSLVELDLGVTFTPKYSLHPTLKPKSVQLHIKHPTCKRTIGLAWNKKHFKTPAMEQFIAFVTAYFAQLESNTE
ncbi:LysR family transcriptional regulator [Bacillaceae bacterium Marseille-Q3522]|nr:LysR family transcriptional regulator [Bacillaceae bacterium Marseille-Q3522]